MYESFEDSKINEVYLKIETEPHVEYELRDRFTFEVESAKFMPQYRGDIGMERFTCST